METSEVQQAQVHLAEPPVVVSLGVGVHGKRRRVDVFRLRDLWQLHLYRYQADLVVDGVPHTIRPGCVSLVPAGVVVHYTYHGPSEHLYAHIRLSNKGEPRPVPVVQDAGAETPVLSGLMQQAISAWPSSPQWATAEVWSVLWRIAHLADVGQTHAAVAAAIAHIEANLAGTLAVPDIARAAEISHNHLTRLFRAETGDTVVAYIRRRRVERARHLLRESTLPIPSIATAVGIGDIQAFNKACRRELGASPRAVRAGR